jgi:hypothetical protein
MIFTYGFTAPVPAINHSGNELPVSAAKNRMKLEVVFQEMNQGYFSLVSCNNIVKMRDERAHSLR